MYEEEISQFSRLMVREMEANSNKGDMGEWLKIDTKALLADVLYHAGKLAVAMREKDEDRVEEHAADVANLAMMTMLAYRVKSRLNNPDKDQEVESPLTRYNNSPSSSWRDDEDSSRYDLS